MTPVDVDVEALRREQAVRILEAFAEHAEFFRVQRLTGGRWRVLYLSNAAWRTSGHCDGNTLADAMAQVAGILSLDCEPEKEGIGS